MRFSPKHLVLALLLLVASAAPGHAFTQAELIDGFYRTVFGSEYPNWGWQSRIVKKFTEPVRFHIEDRSTARRGGEALRFVNSLPKLIRGLEVAVVTDPLKANFRIFIIDREEYREVVTREIYGRPSSAFAPGKCLVRVLSGHNGIQRSDAVIVADEGDFLFQRCLIEEILQGLGPVNDDPLLAESVFNDQSRHSTFTLHDRYILNMLYDPRVRAGMARHQVEWTLPEVAADALRRVR